MDTVFHEGELAVQRRTGVQRLSQRVGGIIKADIPPIAQEFLRQQHMVIAASSDAKGRVWASVLAGPVGFLQPVDGYTVHINTAPLPGDRLYENLRANPQIGLLAIDFANRRRMRLNGIAALQPGGEITVQAREVYSNCNKYIQSRCMMPAEKVPPSDPAIHQSPSLTDSQMQWIACADTFFIASAHPEGGADASHRGGSPGFVALSAPDRLRFPDYSGNRMFNTLGNLAANPQAGLLFIDFERGNTLQLAGQATILWDKSDIAGFPGAERVVSFQIEQIVEAKNVLPLRWGLESYSPYNP